MGRRKTHIKSKLTVNKKKRTVIFLTVISIIMCIFVARLVDWQIINHDYYRIRANSSNIYFVTTDPIRGEILDRDGNGLVINDTGFKVVLDRLLIDKNEENGLILRLVSMIEKFGDSWIDILPIKFEDGKYEFFEGKETEVRTMKKILKLSENLNAQECMEKMVAKYKLEDFTPEERRILCSVKYNMEKNGIYFAKSTPYILADNLSKDVVMVLSERTEEFKGVRIQTSVVRRCTDGEIAPHILGYTGLMSAEEYEERKSNYPLDAVIGKSGIEGVFESFLRGVGGKRMIQISKEGGMVDVSEREPAVAGKTLFLTISSALQRVANKSLEENIKAVHDKGVEDCTSGAAVVLDVRDFSVLAASTYPTYDVNKFTKDKAYYSELYSDKSRPLLNRAFSGAYAPGSVYKPLVACAALQTGNVTPEETIYCGGSFNFYHGYSLKCMGHHGNANLITALAKSCNVYFAELGRRLGADMLKFWANKFGIGVSTGVEVGESKGIVAGPEHSEKVGAKWYESGSSQAAIGQSDNMITPLQLATYVATIANGGHRGKTHLVKSITDYSRTNVIRDFGFEEVENVDISAENLDAVKKGMREVAVSGTARDFANYPIQIAAKTGTAQNGGSDHTTFVCFAPYENPEIAIAVVIAHGKYGTASKNVARDIMNEYFKLNVK